MILDKACFERGCACCDPWDNKDNVKLEWIGLTEDQYWKLRWYASHDVIEMIEETLKENNGRYFEV